jgi:hypothetical protein
LVEKKSGDTRVPILLSLSRLTRNQQLKYRGRLTQPKTRIESGDIVLKKKSSFYQRLYYHLPGFLRRLLWQILLRNPKAAFRTMGNVSVTSVGMIGKVNGWFIHKSVHPVSFGVGSVIMKPVVAGNEIKPREILNMTILVDHAVIDGAPMVRFLGDLTDYLENGKEIDIMAP